ncbi:unnamed protein product [Arctia plantaginis]|uniref:Peptidase S1 domain-containing protein n=1 Tax=Arctia plantaginis TaxID=874455 RepID=A0A8S1A0L2_ARCPL|nr:unnamed protein product [Arctia plantaginis]CAB3238076.1 unnamed protein product [Arctia plantaginis]
MASLTWAVVLLAGLTCTHAHALGDPIPIHSLPSIAQIEFRLGSTWRQQCVGSIITNYHMLTAAACVQVPIGRRIRVGSHERAFGGLVRDVGIVSNHDSFGSNGNDGDMSVVRAASAWVFGSTVQSIPIVTQNYVVPANFDVFVAGWGVTTQGGLVGDDRLHVAALKTKPIIECMSQHQGRVTTNMLCVGRVDRPGINFDPSDIGAPVIYSGHLVGVLSFGASANNDELPAVSNAIGSYSDWIVKNVS